jgi:hypothetical protein
MVAIGNPEGRRVRPARTERGVEVSDEGVCDGDKGFRGVDEAGMSAFIYRQTPERLGRAARDPNPTMDVPTTGGANRGNQNDRD